MLMYVTNGFMGPEIRSVDVDRVTDSFVWIKGRRRSRRSSYENYHDTWEDARVFMLAIAENHLDVVNKDQVQAANLVAKLKRMKQPEPEQS